MIVYDAPIGPVNYKRVTLRGRSGKAHRGLVTYYHGRACLVASCSCPGSQNGRLVNSTCVIADGWERANCGN